MKNELIKKYSSDIQGILSCYDRVLIGGIIPKISHSSGLNSFLYGKGIKLKDITQFTNPLRNQVHANAKSIAQASGMQIEHIRKLKQVRKEDIVQKHLLERQVSQGLVCILSAMESCPNFVFKFRAVRNLKNFAK